jgi:fused signal recognition particle receptor
MAILGKLGFFDRLKQGLSKTRQILLTDIDDLVLGEKKIDQALYDELEEALIRADVGPGFTYDLMDRIKEQVRRKELDKAALLKKSLRDQMKEILERCESPLYIPANVSPYTMMVVGVNGTGKTTTIGKLANEMKGQGLSVMIAAADTSGPRPSSSSTSGASGPGCPLSARRSMPIRPPWCSTPSGQPGRTRPRW